MKSIKLLINSGLLVPTAITPIILTGCSVYKDMLKGYEVTYKQIDGTSFTAPQATEKWFDKAKEINNFGEQEFYKSSSMACQRKYSGIGYIEEITYLSEFTNFYCLFNDIKIDTNNHKISYKVTGEVESKDSYKYDGVDSGYGITHYTVEYKVENLEYDLVLYTDKPSTGNITNWMIKPVKYSYDTEESKWAWNQNLENDEKISFNLRYLIEIYNNKGLQSYGYETTEAAILDKDHSYLPELNEILDCFCCHFSYYITAPQN